MASSSRTKANTSALPLIDDSFELFLNDEKEEPATIHRRNGGQKLRNSSPYGTPGNRYAHGMRDEREGPISIFEIIKNNKQNLRFGLEGRDEYHIRWGDMKSDFDALETNRKDSLIVSPSQGREWRNQIKEIDKKRVENRMVRPVGIARDASSRKRESSRGISTILYESRNPSGGKTRTSSEASSSFRDKSRAWNESRRTSSRGRSRVRNGSRNSKNVRSKSNSRRQGAQTPQRRRHRQEDPRAGKGYIHSLRCSRPADVEDWYPISRSKKRSAGREYENAFDISYESPQYSSHRSPHCASRSPRSDLFHSCHCESKKNSFEQSKNCLGMG